MTTTINADNGVVSGSAGLKETPDSSGILALQTNGVTAVTIDGSQDVSLESNLNFSGTGPRIIADLSTSTVADRLAFQSSVVNGNSNMSVLPNGTNTTSSLIAYNNSDPTNSSYAQLLSNAASSIIVSGIRGTGTYLPLSFITNNTTQLTIDTSGTTTFTGNVVGVLKSGTAVAASGTSVDFTGIPASATRITVMLSGVSLSTTVNPLIRIGSGSFDSTSTYLGTVGRQNASGNNLTAFTTSFLLSDSNAAATVWYGAIVLAKITGNVWVCTGSVSNGLAGASAFSCLLSGSKSLSGALDRVQVASSGAGTFDAGTINILWE